MEINTDDKRGSVKMEKKLLFLSDFDKTLSEGDVGHILSAKLGITAEQFDNKIEEIKKRNIVQLGGELAHLIVRDPMYAGKVTRDLLYEVGAEISLKKGVTELMGILAEGIDNFRFSTYIVSAAPKECVEKAVENIFPSDNIFGTVFAYKNGVVVDVERANAGHAKVATLDMLKMKEDVPRNAIIYVGDGSSDIHVMLHTKSYNGYTITVSPAPYMGHICRRSVISDNVLSILVPILEDLLKYDQDRIRSFFEEKGHAILEWNRADTEWLDIA
ncbi:MAG: haloacid dehalogenase-like hydrolase [Candidatus Omnitrophica bacterium]|nr:haloacid dehalogenase-like hydrolase [Candidatus Omnitrophota bacterium]